MNVIQDMRMWIVNKVEDENVDPTDVLHALVDSIFSIIILLSVEGKEEENMNNVCNLLSESIKQQKNKLN